METQRASREELLDLLHAAVDGFDGYVCACGDLRYWNAEKIERAHKVHDPENEKPVTG